MPIQILMPALSPTMTEGNLAKWHKKAGDKVKSGDVLAEIETDKATMEVEAIDEGTMGQIVVPEGTEGVKVNEVIALLLEDGEDASALGKAGTAAPKLAPAPETPKTEAPATPAATGDAHDERVLASPLAKRMAAQAGIDLSQVTGSGPHGKIMKADIANGGERSERVFASPLAKSMAAKAGIDLSGVSGSGPQGRIVKSDIEAALAKPTQAKPATRPVTAASASPAAGHAPSKDQIIALAGNPPYTEVPNTPMRKVIARRMTESKQTVPHYYVTVDCEIDQLLKLREDLNKTNDLKLSVNDFVIKASALALKKVPEANASWSEEATLLWNSVDISVAVAIEGGLITPIIKQAEQKGLAVISTEMRDLAARAKEGKLKLEEFQGGTFSISNLGMFGVKHFEAVINPPQGAILAVGAGEQRPVVKNGALAIATVMSLTLAVDHRVIDGAGGAKLISAIKKLIENPISMLL